VFFTPPRTLFILVDGLGLGPHDPRQNPIYGGSCPCLQRLLEDHATPIDATMGVGGIPQSATGQTALLTGVNAAREMGRHIEGFPGPALREIIRARNLYDRLTALGFTSTFANAYYVTDMAEVEARRVQSVTTVAALKAFGRVRDAAAMRDHRAVYQDLTRESLRERGYDGPLVTPADSARDLVGITADYDFTLFEYFQTDRMGHKGTREEVDRVLALFDAFLSGVLSFYERPGNLFVMTSDHGNIEVADSRSHSVNPVPLVAIGQGADFLRERVRSVTDVTPMLMELYAEGGVSSPPVG
jgi:2,3-bisphosphoglycerate-independent phosphoglycerate mutase